MGIECSRNTRCNLRRRWLAGPWFERSELLQGYEYSYIGASFELLSLKTALEVRCIRHNQPVRLSLIIRKLYYLLLIGNLTNCHDNTQPELHYFGI